MISLHYKLHIIKPEKDKDCMAIEVNRVYGRLRTHLPNIWGLVDSIYDSMNKNIRVMTR